jgi:glutamate/tyrosine decarboxylase-like PLP-dependent enzyme
MDDFAKIFGTAADYAATFRASVGDRPVGGYADLEAARAAFDRPLPDAATEPTAVLDELIAAAEPSIMGTAGPRFFGFVIGGALPAASAAEMLTVAWDQPAYSVVSAPAAIAVEERVGAWLKDLFGIPATASVGFVTGAQAANTVGLAAGRHHVLSEVGWDVERRGLAGAPHVRIIASVERHATVDRSLRLLGFGTDVVEPVATDPNGAIDAADLARVLAAGPPGPTIVYLQTGNVNTGACDDLRAACTAIRAHGGWAHVDGAFGLWAAASPSTRHLVDGIELADSWGCDGHKWLNVPYDSAFAFVRDRVIHAAAMSYTAPYLSPGGESGGGDFTAESSRRARGFPVWAALRELGRDGVAELVDRCCRLARRFADRLSAGGLEIANDVVLNQVLVGLGDDARTDRVIAAVQREGTCWMGATTWHGRRLMRISVSNYSTTEADVDASAAAILRVVAATP